MGIAAGDLAGTPSPARFFFKGTHVTVPINRQQASATWGADAVYITFAAEGTTDAGPMVVAGVTNPFPVTVIGKVQGLAESGGKPGKPGNNALSIQGVPGMTEVNVKLESGPGVNPNQPIHILGQSARNQQHQKTTITSSTAETTIVTREMDHYLDIYSFIVANSSVTAATVTVKDSTAGTTRFIIAVPGGETRGFHGPRESAHRQTSKNQNWTATCTSVASIEITVSYLRAT